MNLKHLTPPTSPIVIVAGALAIFAAGLGGAMPVHAKALEQRSERVSYADLNLSTKAGQETFVGRLRRAVRRVCAYESFSGIEGRQQEVSCRAATMRTARTKMVKAIRLAQAG